MAIIKSTNGYDILVDDEDRAFLSLFNWYVDICGQTRYASRKIKNKKDYIHRVIMEKYFDINNKPIDHADRNGLNNTKANLRMCNSSQNGVNSEKQQNNTSGYKCVYSDNNSKSWNTKIDVYGKVLNIGNFKSKRYAAIAYDIYAKKHYGEFAYLNCPEATQNEIRAVQSIIDNPKKKEGKSKYRGVCYSGRDNLWISQFQYQCIKYVRYSHNEIDAAKAYNQMVVETIPQEKQHKYLNII